MHRVPAEREACRAAAVTPTQHRAHLSTIASMATHAPRCPPALHRSTLHRLASWTLRSPLPSQYALSCELFSPTTLCIVCIVVYAPSSAIHPALPAYALMDIKAYGGCLRLCQHQLCLCLYPPDPHSGYGPAAATSTPQCVYPNNTTHRACRCDHEMCRDVATCRRCAGAETMVGCGTMQECESAVPPVSALTHYYSSSSFRATRRTSGRACLVSSPWCRLTLVQHRDRAVVVVEGDPQDVEQTADAAQRTDDSCQQQLRPQSRDEVSYDPPAENKAGGGSERLHESDENCNTFSEVAYREMGEEGEVQFTARTYV